MKEELTDSQKYRTWEKTVAASGCAVKAVKPLQLIHNKTGQLLFALLQSEVKDPAGRALMPTVLIRGHACVVVPLAVNTQTGEEKFVMVRQRRIGNGHDSLEFPAGMLDSDTHPLTVALHELREETGLEASAEDLKPLHQGPLYSSPGLSDEGIFYFGCRLWLAGPYFTALEGRLTGNAGENERITVTLKTRAGALKEVTSLQTRLGFYLFQDYFAE